MINTNGIHLKFKFKKLEQIIVNLTYVGFRLTCNARTGFYTVPSLTCQVRPHPLKDDNHNDCTQRLENLVNTGCQEF